MLLFLNERKIKNSNPQVCNLGAFLLSGLILAAFVSKQKSVILEVPLSYREQTTSL